MQYQTLEHGKSLLTLPIWENVNPEAELDQLRTLVKKGEQLLSDISVLAKPNFDSVVLPFEELFDEMGKCWGPISHLHNVALTRYPDFERIYNEGVAVYTEFSTKLSLHQGLYQAYKKIQSEQASLREYEKKIIDDAVLDFELSGVGLASEKKKELGELNLRISTLGNQFGNNVQRSQDEWSKEVKEKERLAGLPSQVIEILKANATKKGLDGYLVTLYQPIYIAIMQHATDRELRREVYEAYVTRASERDGGRYDNSGIMKELVLLRHKKAVLLGFQNYNELSLAKKMAKKVETVDKFYQQLITKSRPIALREFSELEAFALSTLGLSKIEPWDVSFASRLFEEVTHQIDHEEIRKYFPKDRVMNGLFKLVERLFNMRLVERPLASTWRESVTYYELLDASGNLRGAVYADLFAEEGKRPGAWMDVCIERREIRGNVQLPVAYFNCNFTQATGGKTSTLRHDEIETVFHEFGHVLHHIANMMDRPDLSMGGVEWDAVEFPSQVLENWCWERDLLLEMSSHVETGGKIPEEMVKALRSSRTFQPGIFITRQLALGYYDWVLHRDHGADDELDVSKLWNETWKRVAVTPMPEWGRYANSFLHIFDGSYAAGYYSYLWAEVLASDAFEAFQQQGVFSKELGGKYLHDVLEVGSARDMAESYRAFRGHDPDPLALMRKYGLESADTEI